MVAASRKGEGGAKFNDAWHTDVSFDQRPPMASMLQADVLPSLGGDTLFISMYAAWDTLSDGLKALVDGLEAFHDGVSSFMPYLLDPGTRNGPKRLAKMKAEMPGCIHPETGKKALFVNRA
jgi:taurine dioxygenase